MTDGATFSHPWKLRYKLLQRNLKKQRYDIFVCITFFGTKIVENNNQEMLGDCSSAGQQNLLDGNLMTYYVSYVLPHSAT
mmetsp:Transcript_25171/g.58175  ORF Transcript_25171/g.58175 Transcript_25171/m.58175 type:complete len:80 (-) Transcript_25171:1751-1990(-)